MFVEFQYYTTSGTASQEFSFNFFTPSGGLPPLNVEFAQHYLQCKSVTSCFPGEVLSPPNAHYLVILRLQQHQFQWTRYVEHPRPCSQRFPFVRLATTTCNMPCFASDNSRFILLWSTDL